MKLSFTIPESSVYHYPLRRYANVFPNLNAPYSFLFFLFTLMRSKFWLNVIHPTSLSLSSFKVCSFSRLFYRRRFLYLADLLWVCVQ